MKLTLLTECDLEPLVQEELARYVKEQPTVTTQVLTAECSTQEALTYLMHGQAARRALYHFDQAKEVPALTLKDLEQFFSQESTTFKIEVEGVRGQDNRLELAKEVSKKIFDWGKAQKLDLSLDFKKPHVTFILFFNNDTYTLGVDLAGEMNARHYRVFPHSASFKGDHAYAIVHAAEYKPENRLVVGFCKDGAIAIEAALLAAQKPIRKKLLCRNYTLFKDIEPIKQQINTPHITAFDLSTQPINAARKNAHIAGVKQEMTIARWQLDELDVKFKQDEIDHCIFHITTKDERKLNEIYYQTNHIIKPGGTLLFVSRPTWEPTIHSKYELVKETELIRGDSVHALWLLRKK